MKLRIQNYSSSGCCLAKSLPKKYRQINGQMQELYWTCTHKLFNCWTDRQVHHLPHSRFQFGIASKVKFSGMSKNSQSANEEKQNFFTIEKQEAERLEHSSSIYFGGKDSNLTYRYNAKNSS